MKVESIHLTGFKRFTDLTITGLTRRTRLVVLLGPNGSGKSSLFEAFNTCLATINRSHWFDRSYHLKVTADEDTTNLDQQRFAQEQQQWAQVIQRINIKFFDQPTPNWTNALGWEKDAFYLRGASRTAPEHRSDNISRRQDLSQAYNPSFFSYVDSQVQVNYQELIHRSLSALSNPGTKTSLQVGEEGISLFKKLQASVANVFPGLVLEGMGDPTNGGTFVFKKAKSGKWRFKNLSSGEKSAFDLLLDFHIKAERLKSTVFCVDEPELHMHTELQSRLLKEILSNLPEEWQLWLATHSAGMVRAAQNWSEVHPDEAAFLDFADCDFDDAVELTPQQANRRLWKKTFAVALGDFAELLLPREIIFCEGSPRRSGQFDARCFRKIFAETRPDTEFVSLGSASEVERGSVTVATVLSDLTPGVRIRKVIDRDDRSSIEVEDARRSGIVVLSRRNLEAYLYDKEIVEKLCRKNASPAKIPIALNLIDSALAHLKMRNLPVDDVKSASGEIYVGLKKLLSLTQCGNTSESFCIDTLSPLVTPDTGVYQNLATELFS